MTSEKYWALQRDVQMHMLPSVQRIRFLIQSFLSNYIDQELNFTSLPQGTLARQRTEIAEYKLSDYIFPVTALNLGSSWEGVKEQEVENNSLHLTYSCIQLKAQIKNIKTNQYWFRNKLKGKRLSKRTVLKLGSHERQNHGVLRSSMLLVPCQKN